MALQRGTEIPTIDCVLLTVTTSGPTPTEIAIQTANKVGVEVQEETVEAIKLISKGVLYSQKPESKVITGHKLTITDNIFIPEIMKILQGGTLKYESAEIGTGSAGLGVSARQSTVTTTLTIVAPTSASQPLTVEVDGSDITVSLATSISSTVTSTATLVKAALEADSEAKALVKVTLLGDGSGVMAAAAETVLPTSISGYTPPVQGSPDKGEVFTLNCYSAIYNTAGLIKGYERISYPNCTGAPIAMGSEDGVFRAPEYTINSAPGSGEAPYDLDIIPTLPTIL